MKIKTEYKGGIYPASVKYLERLRKAESDVSRLTAENERLRVALQKIANHNDNERITREADDMAEIAREALDDA